MPIKYLPNSKNLMMSQILTKFADYYVVPVCFVSALLFFIKNADPYADEEEMADALDEHIRRNYYAYATLQTIFYVWIYFLIF